VHVLFDVDLSAPDQICIHKILGKNRSTLEHYIAYLWTTRKLHGSHRKEILYDILVEFGVPIELFSVTYYSEFLSTLNY